MEKVSKITGNQFKIYLAYTIALRLVGLIPGAYFVCATMNALAIGFHAVILIISSIVSFNRQRKEEGRAQLLSGILILLIGMPACFFAYMPDFKFN